MRNDVRPAQNTMISTVNKDSQSKNTVDNQTELQDLREKILQLRKKCLVSIT